MDISIPYYEDNSRISNSAIGTFIKSGPLALKHLMDGEGEKLTLPALEKGTMIHEYILQPKEFWKDYDVLDFTVPKVKQQKDFLDEYARLCYVNPLESQDKLKTQAYRFAYKNKKSDEKCIEEAENLIMMYQDYLDHLDKKRENKKIISFADLNTLKKIKANLEEHKKANELLWHLSEDYECHNEFHINWEWKDVHCKSLLDRVCFNFKEKKVILIDLKTTPNVYSFKHSVEEFDYYRQLAYYVMAIFWYLEHVKNVNPDEFDLEIYIIAIGKDKDNQVRVFNMKNDSELENRGKIIAENLKRISYHVSSNNWKFNREYYEEDGIEELNS